MIPSVQKESSCVVGRYNLHAEIAFGGTATIHLGRLVGPVGFARTVAIKRLHGSFARDPTFVAMFMDEARLAARIRHPNVASIIDVVAENGELLLVMDYIHGESLAHLLSAASERGLPVDPHLIVKVMTEVLSGLHAAHELKNELGEPLGVVHRDISPQNIIVAADGVAHLIDFGIAKAAGRVQHTQEGQVKGKLRYMAPEQIESGDVDRRTDIFAAAVVLWEALVGRFLFSGTDAKLLYAVLTAPIPPPSRFVRHLPKALEAIVMKGLARDPQQRFSTAVEMADALESAMRPATSRQIAHWMQGLTAATLENRAQLIRDIESSESSGRHSSLQRVPDSLPLTFESLTKLSEPSHSTGKLAIPDIVEPGEHERHTIPLVVQTYEPQGSSSAHELGDSALQRAKRHWRWGLMVGIAALAVSCVAALLILSRARTRDAARSNEGTAAPSAGAAVIETTAIPASVTPAEYQTRNPTEAAASVSAVAPLTSVDSSTPDLALGPRSTSLPGEAVLAERTKQAGANARSKRPVPANKPAPAPRSEPPTETATRKPPNSLYTRD